MATTTRGAYYLLSLLVLATFFWAWGPMTTPVSAYGSTIENAKERVNMAADGAKFKSSEAIQDAKEASESWADWGQEKITEGLGVRHENAARQTIDMVGDITMKTQQKMSDVVSGAADITTQKAGEAKDVMMDKAGDFKETMLNKAGYAYGVMADRADQAADTAEGAYEGAKRKLGEAYETARDTMSESAKTNYEAAKEKVSQATGDMGAKMNQKVEEL